MHADNLEWQDPAENARVCPRSDEAAAKKAELQDVSDRSKSAAKVFKALAIAEEATAAAAHASGQCLAGGLSVPHAASECHSSTVPAAHNVVHPANGASEDRRVSFTEACIRCTLLSRESLLSNSQIEKQIAYLIGRHLCFELSSFIVGFSLRSDFLGTARS